ncbi:MAG TPA: hypothetical protein VF482_22755 [Trebonia sp.]
MPPAAPEPVGDVVAVLARQHHELDELVRDIERQPRIGHGIKGEPLRRVQYDIVELRRRFVVQEWCKNLYLWPVLRRAWPDGNALADAARRRQQHVEDRLIELRWFAERDPRAAGVLDEVLAGIGEHVGLEQHILGRMRRTLPQQVLAQAGRKLTRGFLVPTRPHPYLPAYRWAAVVLGPVTGAADRIIDSFSFGPSGA